MNDTDIAALIEQAELARERAYAPYSGFRVGCALMDERGAIHLGCNVENAAYGPTNCAERTALFRAVADGCRPRTFRALAVMAETAEPVTPCGTCRQVMSELCAPDMPVILCAADRTYRITTVAELLPGAFRLPDEAGEGERP